MTVYGYARVSTVGQDHAAQTEALQSAGAEVIFAEKIGGGKRANRPQLARMLASIKAGDAVIITRISRMARSTLDLLTILKEIVDKGGTFTSLREAWADMTTAQGRLMITFAGGLAEFEKELINERITEGRDRAKDRGVRFGRPRTLTQHQRTEALARLASGEAVMDVARSFNVHHSMISRLSKSA
ncbi:recombinase family protein [Bradyrhizobium sp. I1.7.5]|uniref:recombinase family protein n=1 Tax=Bradyrhizobium sp. I1.7.5 TaxID=3156363 RepID=UPI003392F39D